MDSVATSTGSTVLPITRGTKSRLDDVKERDDYETLLRALLEECPPEKARARIDAARAAGKRRIARGRALIEAGEDTGRSPGKQLMIADLAGVRWNRWLKDGRVERLGPRHFRFRVEARADRSSEVRIVRKTGRGIAP